MTVSARLAALAVITFLPLPVAIHAQSAPEHHAWQDAKTFEPVSRTAIAITGPVTLSGNPDFATPGSKTTIAFGNGSPLQLVSEGAFWRKWGFGDDKQTAEVFRMEGDPGELLNGNHLCGGEPSDIPIFIAFHEADMSTSYATLQMAVFRSLEPPADGDSPGLCGTYSYALD